MLIYTDRRNFVYACGGILEAILLAFLLIHAIKYGGAY